MDSGWLGRFTLELSALDCQKKVHDQYPVDSDLNFNRTFVKLARTGMKSRKSLILGQIGPFTLDILDLGWRKNHDKLIMENMLSRR